MPRRRQKPIAKKHKFVKDGIFFAELNGFLGKELAKDGYGGCEVRVTPTRTEVIIRATKTTNVVGEKGTRIQELTALVQKRFNFEKGKIVLFAQMVKNRGLSALAQAEAVRYRLFEGLSVRRAAYSVLKFIMERGAQGCEVIVSGKLRGQRAKSMKFRDGWMIHAGDATNQYIDEAVKHVHLRQGVIGIKVKIMLPHDPDGTSGGPTKQIPDKIVVKEPKDVDPRLYEQEFAAQQQRAMRPFQRYQEMPSAQQVQGGPHEQVQDAAQFGGPQRYEQPPQDNLDQLPPVGGMEEPYAEDVEQAPYDEQYQGGPQYAQEQYGQQQFSQFDPNAPSFGGSGY